MSIESASRRNLMEDIKNNYPSIKGVNWDSMIKMDFVQMHEVVQNKKMHEKMEVSARRI